MKIVYWWKLSIDESCLLMKVVCWWKVSIDESFQLMKFVYWWQGCLPRIFIGPNNPSFSDCINTISWWSSYWACLPPDTLMALYSSSSTFPCSWPLGCSYLSSFSSSDIFQNLLICLLTPIHVMTVASSSIFLCCPLTILFITCVALRAFFDWKIPWGCFKE